MNHAIRVHEHGGPEKLVWEEVPLPDPKPGEALVRQKAVGLNYIDVYFRTGLYKAPTMPATIGMEAAGVVEAVGDGVTDLKPGDRVAYAGALGAYAEARCVPAEKLVKLPEGIDFTQGAAMMLQGMTAQYLLRRTYVVKKGETILVQAAGSGIGTVAVKQAKALGCTVIATAGDDGKCAKARALGADHVVNYTTGRFESVARRVTNKRGVDVVFEHVGAATWAGSLFSLRMGGRLVTCGSTSGVAAETNLMMLFQRQLRIFGSFGASMRNIADGYAKMAGGLTPVIDTVLPLERFAEGIARLESRRVFGKIVVTL